MADLDPRRLGRRDLLATLAGAAAAPWLPGCSADEPTPAPQRPRTIEPNARPQTVAAISTAEGRGATVDRLFPTMRASYMDPFVLFDDFRVTPPAGFPDHPHRGFEAFTYMLDGAFHHQDNLGNDSYVSSGGVQLFTSGRGARHSEMPGEAKPNRGIQLWVNLPRALKPMDPEYAAVQARDIPEVGAKGVRTRTVVGPGSPVRLRTEVRYLDLAFERGARFADELAAHLRGVVYVLDGRVKMGDVELAAGTAAVPVPGALELVALADARAIFLAGRPHGEPIRHRGPFVD